VALNAPGLASVWPAVGCSEQPTSVTFNASARSSFSLIGFRSISNPSGPGLDAAPAWVSAKGVGALRGGVAGCPSVRERAQVSRSGTGGSNALRMWGPDAAKRGPEAPFPPGQKVLSGLALTPENCPEAGAKPPTDPTPSPIPSNT